LIISDLVCLPWSMSQIESAFGVHLLTGRHRS
jgi:hypothetical protein